MIHATAIVETNEVGDGVEIGPFVVIGEGASIGDGVRIHPHVTIAPNVHLGAGVEVFPGAFLGREPKGAGATAREPVFDRVVRVGSNSSIGPNAVIYYDVSIGTNTLIGDGASIREKCSIGDQCIVSRYVTVNYSTTIGNRVKIMDLTHVTGNTVIEDDVFVSAHVGMANDNSIGKAGFHPDIVGPYLETGCAVGLGAQLLPGVRIGAGAIVAAQALVTRNVAPDALVAGVPAKAIRRISI
jgi:UDP-3-O-[3-hydroxymyristoyl] glucosamine N-acyltransferase